MTFNVLKSTCIIPYYCTAICSFHLCLCPLVKQIFVSYPLWLPTHMPSTFLQCFLLLPTFIWDRLASWRTWKSLRWATALIKIQCFCHKCFRSLITRLSISKPGMPLVAHDSPTFLEIYIG